MNIKWIIIGAIGLLIFIMMGTNPFDPPKGYVYEDPVKKSLKDRSQGKTGGFGGGLMGGGMVGAPPSIGGDSGIKFPGTANPNAAPMVMPPVAPNAPDTSANPTQPAPFRNLPTAPSNEPLPPGATLTVPKYVPLFTLAGGQPIRFVGIYAFTQDEQGHIVRMEDGEYTMVGGLKITIKDGANQWRPIKWDNKT